MTYLKEWENGIEEKVINIFAKWEKNNLTIVYGKRERTVADTYGLPYTSSGECAGLWNTNVDARLKNDKQWRFVGIVVTEDGGILALFMNDEDKERLEVIGRLRNHEKNH